MARDHDFAPRPRRILEFIVFGTTNIDPSFGLKSGDDLAGIGFKLRHGHPLAYALSYALA